ncbi:vitamin K epoxide reductase family protein [Nostoc parmelioides]|uniref:Vitamin K epoxide reductase family protein n=1 Tax=Nostoc parmelioides FACHB-3921 TaxID=2692909 RepID=A0ABR8B9C1_9NOSO|nr:vitamin K epoxide reductase family protein [Nostoc parmelioides]MBD2250426.1 vitamin K epoxide reductase family protein [Nostoc parmelioides FACHB-3921]
MIRRRSTPWIHKWSRLIIAAIAGFGALNTGYLTIEKLTGGSPACVAQAGATGCTDVLSSPWATILGQPLALFGFLAYTSMLVLALAPVVWKGGENNSRKQLENVTWWLLLVGAIAMSVFSGYLMYLLAFEIKALCLYCISSALFSLSLLVLTIVGRSWEDIGQILFTALIVGMVTLIGTLGVYAGINKPDVTSANIPPGQLAPFVPKTNPNPEFGWEINTTSGEAEIALAQHLVKVGAKEYVAYWCPHCHDQKLLFGKEAYQIISDNIKIECAEDSPKGQPELCRAAKIQGFPTWIINGQTYSGVQNLSELAKITGYTGPSNFKYFK